jgi:uncharacterized protein (DUF58 family)
VAARRSWLRRLLTARGRSLEITRAGWLFIVLTLAIGFAAINSGANLLHAVFGAQMALIVGSGVLSEGAVRRVRARRRVLGPVHAGQAARAIVEIENVDRRSDALSVSVEDDDREEGPARGDAVFAVRVPARGRIALPTVVTMPQRGLHPLPRAVVATRFPFGLFVKRRDLDAPPVVTVYPALHPVRDTGPSGDPGQGDAGAGRRARAGEFFGLREYRDGDDARRISWRASARLGRPVIREHEARGRPERIVEIGAGKSGDAAFEAAVSEAASRAIADLDAGARVGMRYAGTLLVAPDDGPGQRERVLEALARIGAPSVSGEART